MENRVGGIILSGGKSRRMGKPKAFLKIGDTTFLEKIISEYNRAGVKKIWVVLNYELFNHPLINLIPGKVKGVEFICNDNPDYGRFYSIKLGLTNARECDFCFVQNIDNPLVDAALLNQLLKNKNSLGYSAPVYKGRGGHPVLISSIIIKRIIEFRGYDFTLREILGEYDNKMIPVFNQKIMANINSMEDYNSLIIN